MKKITWKRVRGDESSLEGFVNGELAFIISGRLCVQDLREMKASEEWIAPKAYLLDTKGDTTMEAKSIASDLLNEINLEKHQANWQAWEDENKKTGELIAEVDAFLDSLKDK